MITRKEILLVNGKFFGVMISVKKEIIDDVFGKFIDIGFAVSKDSEKEKIWIYPQTYI